MPENNLSTSQNGIGRVAQIQPQSHFFLEGTDCGFIEYYFIIQLYHKFKK